MKLISCNVATAIFLVSLFCVSVVRAEEDDFMLDDDDSFMLDGEEAEDVVEEHSYSSYIEFGGLYSSSDSAKFGEYTGLDQQPGFAIGNFNIQQRAAYDSEDTEFWQISGTDLGLDSRSVQAEYGKQGHFSLFFAYDQLPHNQLVNARTPFNGVGTEHLQLPDTWVSGATTAEMTLLNDSLHHVAIGTERRKYNGGFSLALSKTWNVKMLIQHEDKDGLTATGGVMGVSGFNPLAIVAPKPIDQETNEVDMSLAYNGDAAQVELRYHLSLFDNHIDSFSWQNPYQLRLPSATGGYLDTVGGLSAAPDNQSHKISLSGAYRLAATTRLSGNFSYGLMRQDNQRINYTINPALTVGAPLTGQNTQLDAETWHAGLVFTAAPIKNVSIRSSYVYDQRHNSNAINDYAVLRNDSENQITQLNSQTIRANLPYGRTQHKFKLASDYRFLPKNKITIGYIYEGNERDYAEVERTDEHTAHIKLASNQLRGVSSWLKYEYSARNATDYQGDATYLASHTEQYLATVPESLRFENDPLIRQYNLADRQRNKVSFALTWMALESLSVGLNGRYTQDDYLHSELGLTDSENFNGTVDINYSLNAELNLHGFYSYEYLQNQQTGYERISNLETLVPRDPDKFWRVDTVDKVHTVGAGLEWQVIKNVFDLQLDYTFSDALTSTGTEQQNVADTPLPDLTTVLHSINVSANYQLLENMRLQLSYRFESWQTDDFALDNIASDSINEVLSLGNSSPDYDAHVVGVSAFYEF